MSVARQMHMSVAKTLWHMAVVEVQVCKWQCVSTPLTQAVLARALMHANLRGWQVAAVQIVLQTAHLTHS